MKAKELIGKNCIRETPVMVKKTISTGYGLLYMSSGERVEDFPDYTYCTDPVRIVAATDHNIVCEKTGFNGKPFVLNLDERYCDDSWIDYDALVASGAGLTKSDTEAERENE